MPRNLNSLDRARVAFQHAVGKAHLDNREPAVLGWRKAETVAILAVPGRANYLYITKSDQTVAIALNRAGVPQAAFLPVWVVLENNTFVIVGRNNADAATLTNVPDSDYGVNAHPLSTHSDVTLTALADGEILEWDATASVWVNVGIGAEVGAAINAATADTPLDADKFGFWDVVDAALKSITWTNLLAAIHSAAHALTNKTIDSTNIASLTAKNPPVDADSVVIVDSAAANVFKSVTWANIKATLKTYFDTLYTAINTAVLLTGAQTVAGVKTLSDDLIVGVIRRAVETGDLFLMGGTSTTQGPYIQLVGKDAGGGGDGDIQYVATIESSANGNHVWFAYNGTSFVELMRLTAGGVLSVVGGASDSSMKFGDGLEIQGYNVNNNWIADNIYFDGTNFRYRANGFGVLHYFTGGNWVLYTAPSGTAGNVATLTQRFITTNTGRIGFGSMATVQGAHHIHDGTSGKLFVTKTAIDGTAQTIIPDGTGDVTVAVCYAYMIKDSSGVIGGQSDAILQLSNTATLLTDASNGVTLTLSATGGLTVARSSGSRTFTLTISCFWQ